MAYIVRAHCEKCGAFAPTTRTSGSIRRHKCPVCGLAFKTVETTLPRLLEWWCSAVATHLGVEFDAVAAAVGHRPSDVSAVDVPDPE